MPRNLIQTLMTAMPRYPEEEGNYCSVGHDRLIKSPCEQYDIDTGIAENTVLLCEYLLDGLSVL